MSNEIKEIIEALDKNIEFLESPYRLENKDIKGLLIDLIGTIRDMWENLEEVFGTVDKLKETEEATKKEKKFEEKPNDNQDIKNLYV